MEVGSTATVSGGVLTEFNGKVAKIESYCSSSQLYTCSVALPSGVEEVITLKKENLENAVPPKVRKAQLANIRVELKTPTAYFFPEFPNSRLQDWWQAYQGAFKAFSIAP